MIVRLLLLAGVVLCSGAGSSLAEAREFRARYEASLLGLPIGRADFSSRFEGENFALSGRFASAGIARIFDRTDGTTAVQGRFTRSGVQPDAYRLNYTSGKKRQKTEIDFSGGRVTKTLNVPKPKKRGRNWIPVADEHLVGVADPLSAMLIRAANSDEVCNRTLKVYDGEIRVDLVLRKASDSESLGSGTVTCRARFVPVSGYRKNRSAIQFLRDRSKILIAFAPVGQGGIHSPVEASVGTEIGTVRIRAYPAE
ncbi:MAG TPA: DUF3108 domain-containing protein [Rhizobiaceae bacterium]|nr:DUF3108 domain-containing protein [Rhizobiaceae bacterium]